MTDITIFRQIHYAQAHRFEQPDLLPWDGIRRTERRPVCPQAPSRLEIVQVPLASLAMDEHCQVLSVFTPRTTGNRPVIVFFHGGSFATGGGELPWHDGDKLAAEQDVVVVLVTYRLGVFGYFQHPGSNAPCPGMCDQIVALRWIKANLKVFGGDPANVTVFGQSAGGFSIVTMLAWEHDGELFQRAILQSGATGLAHTRAEAEKTSAMFTAELSGDPCGATVADLIVAQGRLAGKLNRLALWSAVLPDTSIGSGVDVIAGWCRDEALPFVLLQKHLQAAPGTETRFTDETNALLAGGSRTLARDMTAPGDRAFLYRFDWKSPGNRALRVPSHQIALPARHRGRLAASRRPRRNRLVRDRDDWPQDVENLGRFRARRPYGRRVIERCRPNPALTGRPFEQAT